MFLIPLDFLCNPLISVEHCCFNDGFILLFTFTFAYIFYIFFVFYKILCLWRALTPYDWLNPMVTICFVICSYFNTPFRMTIFCSNYQILIILSATLVSYIDFSHWDTFDVSTSTWNHRYYFTDGLIFILLVWLLVSNKIWSWSDPGWTFQKHYLSHYVWLHCGLFFLGLQKTGICHQFVHSYMNCFWCSGYWYVSDTPLIQWYYQLKHD